MAALSQKQGGFGAFTLRHADTGDNRARLFHSAANIAAFS
jgi:hypothetical protein